MFFPDLGRTYHGNRFKDLGLLTIDEILQVSKVFPVLGYPEALEDSSMSANGSPTKSLEDVLALEGRTSNCVKDCKC
jgi:hypothetical protein